MIASKKSVRHYQGSKIARSTERIKKTAEVFTPDSLLDEMTSMIPDAEWSDPAKTFLDNTCGNGNILLYVLKKKMSHGNGWLEAISTIYGVELMQDNVDECRKRLHDYVHENANEKVNEDLLNFILNQNIVCANALEFDYERWCKKGERKSAKETADGFMTVETDKCAYAYYLANGGLQLVWFETISLEKFKELKKLAA